METPPPLETQVLTPHSPFTSAGRPLPPRAREELPVIPDHELLRCIGQGAYGEVWLARNVLGTFRAVKVVFRDSFSSDEPYEREFRGIQRFEPVSRSNDGLVDILQAGRDDARGSFYYVMELADDSQPSTEHGLAGAQIDDPYFFVPETLAARQRGSQRLPVSECLQIGLSLTSALGHLHRHGLIHRDIKPSNIIFVQGVAKLADIGLVVEVEEALSFVGTEGFIPPEGPTSPQADLYSLGKVLYGACMGKDRKQYPEPMTGLCDIADRTEKAALLELNAIILKACAESLSERYRSAEEMHVELALVQSGSSVKWKRLVEKRLAAARKIAVVVAGMAVVATGAYLYQRHQTSEAIRLQAIAEGLEARATIQHAEDLLQRGESSLALAHLAHLLRRKPGNRVASERIVSALTQRHFPRLVRSPFVHSDRLDSARLSPDGQHVLTVGEDRTVQVWNVVTSEATAPPLRHRGKVSSAEFSPDGTLVVTASADGTSCVFETLTGALVFEPLRHDEPVNAAIFSPDGKWIATACADGNARLFDVTTGRRSDPPFPRHVGPVNAIAFSPDSERLAVGMRGGRVRIYDVDRREEEEHRFRLEGPVHHVRFSGDGKRLAASVFQQHEHGDWLVQVWDIQSREPVSPEPIIGTCFHDDRIYSLAFSPDNERIVTATANNAARVWRVRAGVELFQLPHTSLVYAAAFSPDGTRILTASVDKKARLWDAATGAALSEAMAHEGRVIHAEFNQDGSQVLTAGWEDKSARLWDVRPRGPVPREFRHGTSVAAAEFSADGSTALTATAGALFTAPTINFWDYNVPQSVLLWNVGTGVPLSPTELPPSAEAIAAQFTRTGPKALVSERKAETAFAKSAWILDLARGAAAGRPLEHDAEVTCAHFSSDGNKLASGCMDGIVMVWDASQGVALTPPLESKGRLNSVRFSMDGTKLVAASESNSATIWDATTGKRLALLPHGAGVWFAQFSNSGDNVVTASLDYTAKTWSVDGTPIFTLRHHGPVEYAEFSPDGLQLLTASGNEAYLWSTTTGRQLTLPLQHAELVLRARFSPDGLRVLTASMDDTAQLWDSATGLKLGEPLRHGDSVVSASFSSDGRRAITASQDTVARVWDIPAISHPGPGWLPELAEAVGGRRLNAEMIPETVSWAEFAALRRQLESLPESEPNARWMRQVLDGPAELGR